jgi:hypothetical protein
MHMPFESNVIYAFDVRIWRTVDPHLNHASRLNRGHSTYKHSLSLSEHFSLSLLLLTAQARRCLNLVPEAATSPMVIGVKFLSTRNYKGHCSDCNHTFRNGDLCGVTLRGPVHHMHGLYARS